jgi:hypothetical protein
MTISASGCVSLRHIGAAAACSPVLMAEQLPSTRAIEMAEPNKRGSI